MSGYGQVSGRLLRWLVVGPAAVAGLVAVVAGGPVLLLWLGGNPLPDRMLSLGDLVELLTRPDDGQLLVWALTVVGWGAWAVVAGSLLLELAAQVTGRRTPQLPGLSGPQRLAAVLVAAALAALTTPGVSHAHAAYVDQPAPAAAPAVAAPVAEGYPASPVVAVPPPAAPAGVPRTAGSGQETQAGQRTQAEPEAQEELVHEVAKGDWMWHIAGRYLGDELRYPEIAALNPEYAQRYPDYPDHIQPGDQLVLPADAQDRGERGHATGELIGEPEPPDDPAPPEDSDPPPDPEGGESDPTTDPADPADPSDPADPGQEQSPEGGPPPEPPPESPPAGTTLPTPAPTAPPTPSPPAPSPTAASPPAAAPSAPTPPAASQPDTSPPNEAAPAPFPPPPGDAPADPPQADPPPGDPAGEQDDSTPALGPLLTTGVLASVLLGALVLYRWRKMARRRHRRAVSAAGDAPAEATLRAAATADVARLDRALRVLAAGLTGAAAGRAPGGQPAPGAATGQAAAADRAAAGAGVAGPGAVEHPAAEPAAGAAAAPDLPDVGAVWIGDGEIHLILAAPCRLDPPEPFHPGGPGSWFLPADAALPAAEGAIAPLPALVTLGSQPGQHLLVDLERMGMLTVTGPPERGSDLLRYLVAELAHNPWSDQVEVTLAGFAPESAQALAALGPDRITVAESVPEAVHRLRRRLAHTTEALTAHGLADSVHGRLTDTATDTWTPQLLLIDQPGAEHDELLAYLETALTDAGRRCAVAVVVTAPAGVPYGRRTVTITSDGLLKAGFLDDAHAMPAVALPEHLLGPLTDLIRDAATGPDHPIPAATEPWAGGADAAGGYQALNLHGALRGDTPLQLPVITRTAPAADSAESAVPAAGPAEASGRGEPLDQAEPAGLAFVKADDDLDDALAEWLRDADQPPRVALLGPVEITGPGPPPSHRSRVCQELIVYLAACGDRGADAAEIAGQLWPNRQVRPTVRTDVIMNVRRWLGTGDDGEPWLSEAVPDGRYRLRAGVLIDWHLFRRLRARGERRGPAGTEDLRAALRLVRGAPLADAGELASASVRVPYSWLPGSPIAPELVLAGVVDTAHQLVDYSLSAGDLDTAHWAVRQTWVADPLRSDDHPWRDLLRIRRAEGDHERLRSVVTELLHWRDAEHPDELAPATRDLIRSVLPSQPAGSGDPR